jgi:hypothetical protein
MVNVIGNIRVQLYPNVAPFRRRGEQDYEILRNADSFVLRSGDRWRSSANTGRSTRPPKSVVHKTRRQLNREFAHHRPAAHQKVAELLGVGFERAVR